MPSKNTKLQEKLSIRFRKLLSGAADGTPPWLAAVAEGNDVGMFSPQDAPWIIHRDFSTLVGGVRALLMQALHPGSLAGVAQHSRYEQDPLGRLSGTIRWLTVTTFGSVEAVQNEAGRVNRMHTRVSGEYQTAQGGRQFGTHPAHETDKHKGADAQNVGIGRNVTNGKAALNADDQADGDEQHRHRDLHRPSDRQLHGAVPGLRAGAERDHLRHRDPDRDSGRGGHGRRPGCHHAGDARHSASP